MKNYNEMANAVLRRIGEQKNEQRKKRKAVKRVIMPICCLCLAAFLGIGLWQGDFFNTSPPITSDDSTNIEEKDIISENDGSGSKDDIDEVVSPNGQEVSPSDSTESATSESSKPSNNNDVIGTVKVNGIIYVQLQNIATTEIYTPDKYLGKASDFEGTYQKDITDVDGELYTAKEDPNVLIVKLDNGGSVILIKE